MTDEIEQTEKPRRAKTVKARVLRDFWPTDNEMDRVRAGAIVDVTMEALVDGLEAGVLERVKD